MKKNKDKFVLNYENLKALCDQYMKEYKGFKIHIDHSCNKTSNSFYVRFFYKGYTTSLRVSDHDTKMTKIGGAIRNLIIDDVRTYAVYSKICEAGRDLKCKEKHSRIDRLFKEIEREKKCN